MLESQEKITRVEDILAANTVSNLIEKGTKTKNNGDNKHNKKKQVNVKDVSKNVVPRGKPKSGRVWKEPKKKFSSIIKTRGIRLSLEKKQKLRQELKKIKELSNEVKAKKQAEKEAKKERRRENLRRAEANRKKSEVVQVIHNTAKIKRMKKKQLRMIEKRDTISK